jgi:hypothetical protein
MLRRIENAKENVNSGGHADGRHHDGRRGSHRRVVAMLFMLVGIVGKNVPEVAQKLIVISSR